MNKLLKFLTIIELLLFFLFKWKDNNCYMLSKFIIQKIINMEQIYETIKEYYKKKKVIELNSVYS